MSEPEWLDRELVIEINKEAVRRTVEPHVVLSVGLIESALSRPINKYMYDGEEGMAVLAAELAMGLVLNHCFQQGNKRTAYFSLVAFLEQNGYDFAPPDYEEVAHTFIALTDADQRDEAFDDLVDLIEQFAAAFEEGEV